MALLEVTAKAVEAGELKVAFHQLRAFQNKVHTQVGRSNPALAATLIKAAQDMIDSSPNFPE
jgi:hypothetical protein